MFIVVLFLQNSSKVHQKYVLSEIRTFKNYALFKLRVFFKNFGFSKVRTFQKVVIFILRVFSKNVK